KQAPHYTLPNKQGRLCQTPLYFRLNPIVGVSQKRPTISLLNKSDSGVFTFRSRVDNRFGSIVALAAVFLWLAFSSHLPAVPFVGPDRLRQARRLAAAAVVVVAVAA